MDVAIKIDGTRAVFKMEGELSVSASSDLMEAVDNIPPDICDIDIDLSEVDYISSGGLRAILETVNVAEERGGSLRILNPSGEICGVFEMTGLDTVLDIVK